MRPGRQIDNEDSGMIRLDYHFSDKTTAFVRFNSDEALETTPTRQPDGAHDLGHQVQQRRGGVAPCVFADAGQRIQVRNQSGLLPQRNSFAAALYLQRLRIQFSCGRNHVRQSVENNQRA